MPALSHYAWPFAFPFLFVGMWLLVTRMLRAGARMTPELDVATGSPLRESRWGSAFINGISARNCAKLVEYQDGYVLRMMWIFGNGKLWLPKHTLHVGMEQPGRFFIVPRKRVPSSGRNQVILFDRLADFIESSTDPTAAP
jgi:hypothetical protein